MKEIKFKNMVLVSLKDGLTPYHDDMFGDDVWVSLSEKPSFINSWDYREFNGIPIKEMAKFLLKWNEKQANFTINGLSALRKLRDDKKEN